MIDRIRQDIQERLDQLLAEAERLRQALSALGGEQQRQSTPRAARASGSTRSRSRARATGTTRTRTNTASTRSRTRASSTSSRGAASGTKGSVLKALADASGEAMTASEVASKTGLGRASVSTTLSKLAKSGEVTKAQRGYRLSASGDGQPSAAAASASGS